MDTQEAYAARLDAQMRAADARLDQLEAGARAHNARAEMDEVSGLRARRDRVRQQVADVRKEVRDDSDALQRRIDADWTDFRRAVSVAHGKYTAWDAARERRFNARLDEADAAVRESSAKDAELGATVRVYVAEAGDELRDKAAAARRSYDAWRARRSDEKLQQELFDAELELEEASNRYQSALERARQSGPRSRAD